MKRVPTILVPLSKLHAGRDNPRRVKPSAESDQQLLALVRQFGIVQPLIVRPHPENRKEYQIIAGHRRHKALKQIHRNASDDPVVRCEVRDVDDATAEAIALAENFGREQMHPLDEAESFNRLASEESQGVDAISAAFGVTDRYVRQRMKLAGLIKPVKEAYRTGEIDLASAAVFASVPAETQKTLWAETGGRPRHADYVRNLIEHVWVDARHALFDLVTVPDGGVSADLFSERVLVERSVFMSAQLVAMDAEAASLREQGWKEVVVGPYEDLHDHPLSMNLPEREYDDVVTRQLLKLVERGRRWESKLDEISDDDVKTIERIHGKIEEIQAEEERISRSAEPVYSEVTKSVGTAFLLLYPSGEVRREFRVPRERRRERGNTSTGALAGIADERGSNGTPVSGLSPNDLGDRQLADLFTYQVLAVREALLKASQMRKRILVMILHERIRSEALAIRRDANAVSLHAAESGAQGLPVHQRLKERAERLDLFRQEQQVDDVVAFERLAELTDAQINQLIDLLVVECVTSNLQRGTALVNKLSEVLDVQLRAVWRPDTPWLAGYQKMQLARLLAALHGREYNPNVRDERKKSDLVGELDRLFADASTGKIEDEALSSRVKTWCPEVAMDNGMSRPSGKRMRKR